MNKFENLKNQRWLVAVSGGSDSMALLNMCYEENLNICVAHVNYQKRETANRDMQGVQEYCQKRRIPCFHHVVNTYEKGNFQSQARKIRYDFFRRCILENDLHAVLVAHQMEDVLETYMMQKNRGSMPSYYGIEKEVEIYGVKVYRVLLDHSKQSLKEYCINHQVSYFEDESNFEDDYERNRIRHQYIDKMSESEKNAMLTNIHDENLTLMDMRSEAQAYVNRCGEEIELTEFLQESEMMRRIILRLFIIKYTHDYSISEINIEGAIKMLVHHKKTNCKHTINDYFDLCLEYGKIFVDCLKPKQDYEYILHQLEYIETPYFKIGKEGKLIEKLSLQESDFPITIRNARMDDCIKLRMGTKKVNRFFIDNKISHKQRRKWPVVVNCEGNVIFVSGIGCDIVHFSNIYNMFVLK